MLVSLLAEKLREKARQSRVQSKQIEMPFGIFFLFSNFASFTKKGDEWPRGSTGAETGICNRSDCKNTRM